MPDFKRIIQEDQDRADNGLNVADRFKTWNVEDIQQYYRETSLPFAVCLISVAGDLNVGTMIRNSHNFSAEQVLILGRRKYDRRSSVGAEHYTPVKKLGGLNDDLSMDPDVFIQAMKKYNYTPVFVETGGFDIRDIDWNDFTNKELEQNRKICFVFGNEGRGIDESILNCQDYFPGSMKLSVPQLGVMRSFNVAATCSIVLYEYVRQLNI